MKPDLSIVILSWNTSELLERCLSSLEQNIDSSLTNEVIVVDNASSDRSAEMVESHFPMARLLRNETNRGYAAGNNQGIREANGKWILLLNSDTEVQPGAIEGMISFLEKHPDVGGVGCKLLNPDGTTQRACMRFPTLATIFVYDTVVGNLFPNNSLLRHYYMRDWDHEDTREIDQPPGACFMIRREVVDRVGLLDEKMFLFFNDVDYCRRIRNAGFRIYYLSHLSVVHHCGASTKKFMDFGLVWHKNRVAYYRKHYGVIAVSLCKIVAVQVALRELCKLMVFSFMKKGWGRQMGYIAGACWQVLRS